MSRLRKQGELRLGPNWEDTNHATVSKNDQGANYDPLPPPWTFISDEPVIDSEASEECGQSNQTPALENTSTTPWSGDGKEIIVQVKHLQASRKPDQHQASGQGVGEGHQHPSTIFSVYDNLAMKFDDEAEEPPVSDESSGMELSVFSMDGEIAEEQLIEVSAAAEYLERRSHDTAAPEQEAGETKHESAYF